MKMYKIFIFLFLIVGMACKKEEKKASNDFNPPSWIQGTWLYEGDEGWWFTPNDVIHIPGGSLKLHVAEKRDLGIKVNVLENITTELYQIDIQENSTLSSSQIFNRISDDSIHWETASILFPVYLIKQ